VQIYNFLGEDKLILISKMNILSDFVQAKQLTS